MTKIPVTVNITMGVDPLELPRLLEKLQQGEVGMHVLNTLVNQTGINEAQFRGISFDIENLASRNA